MGLLQQLPSKDELTSMLSPITGDEARGTGVAGVLKLLKGIDTSNISASLSANLDQSVSASFAVDSTALTGPALEQFKQVMASVPKDPANLIALLASKLETIKNLSSDDLSAQLFAGINGLQNIETLVPVNTRDLVAGAAERLTQLKGEFISGAFGELRQWSESVGNLYSEIEPLIAVGAGTVEERLIDFLRKKITDLVSMVLPQKMNVAVTVSTQLEGVISTDLMSHINTVKAGLINAMSLARMEFQNGNFSNIAHFMTAQNNYQQLTQTLRNITDKMKIVLDKEIFSAEGLIRAMERLFDDFAQIEIVDLGNIKDKFSEAMKKVGDAISGLDLDAVSKTINEVFGKINDVIKKFDLSQLITKISGLKEQLQTVLNAIDGALFEVIASIRTIFKQIKEALQSVASALGSYDESGRFQFHIQNEIENFLNGIKTTLRETIKPALDQFKNNIGQTLQDVQNKLNEVVGQIGDVTAKLGEALKGVNEQLETMDVEVKMESTGQKLNEMLSGLGAIDFDPIIDPVIAQINEMAGTLKKIDVSAMSEFTIGALKLSVEVVVNIDFSAKITDALMAEFDKLLEIPKGALSEIERRIEGVLQRFGELQPKVLLSPLQELFDPIATRLDNLKLETLLEPLDTWYNRIPQELDKISPAALLQPLIDLHAQLQKAFDSISPAELIRPLQTVIDETKKKIQSIDITGVAVELSGAIDRARKSLDGISPERLLTPLINAFDKIMGALDKFNPAILLEPFKKIFDAILSPLDNLKDEHMRLINEVFAVMRGMIDAFSPEQVFQAIRQNTAAAQSMVQQLNIGGLIAELKVPYDAMHASFVAGGGTVNVTLTASVEGMNPLRDVVIGQVVADVQRFQGQLNALIQAQPPAELVQRYEEIKPKLESLIPTWARENISPASIKRAFQLANPLDMTTEINQLYEAIKQQLRNLDPRMVQENVKASFEQLKNAISSINPQAIVSEVQGAIDALTQRLSTFNVQMIAGELDTIVDELRTIIAGLDPSPIINQLQGLVEEVKGLIAEVKPSNVLSELTIPFQAAKEIVSKFDPALFMEPLQGVFENIQKVLEKIDIGIILQPLVNRLDQLRDALEEDLKRTERAFNGMLQAIPV